MRVPKPLLDHLAQHAWSAGHELLADVHNHRASGRGLADPDRDERVGHSLIAFAEAHRMREAVA